MGIFLQEMVNPYRLQQLLYLPLSIPLHAVADIFFHRHMRKEGVILKQVADIPLLYRQLDVVFVIEKRRSASRIVPYSG